MKRELNPHSESVFMCYKPLVLILGYHYPIHAPKLSFIFMCKEDAGDNPKPIYKRLG
jgi:hypothetical protein